MDEPIMGLPQVIVALVAVIRLGELSIARHNTERLLALGGREVGAAHYPLFILLHGSWLTSIYLLTPKDAPVSMAMLVIFVLLQLLRVWVVHTLGRFWTTRIITVPGMPLVTGGPYRYFRHPNYVVVIGEIAALPLAFGQWTLAIMFSLLNMILLRYRISVEDRALVDRRALPGQRRGPEM